MNIYRTCCAVIFIVISAIAPAASSQSLFSTGHPGARSLGLGKAMVAAVQDPSAAFWNPAALGLIKDTQFRLAADEPFSLEFIGVAHFFPGFGNVSASISRFAFVPGPRLSGSTLERASLGFGRQFTRFFQLGAALHFNRALMPRTNFVTLSAGLLAFPVTRSNALTPVDALLFNTVVPAQRFALGITLQDIGFSSRRLDPFVDLGTYYRFTGAGSTFLGAVRIYDDKLVPRFGAIVPVSPFLNLIAGVDDLDINKTAFGVSLAARNNSLDFAYSIEDRTLLVDFAVRLGKTPRARARPFLERGIALAQEQAFDEALDAVTKFVAYFPDDSVSLVLQNWLAKKADARQAEIDSLLQLAAEKRLDNWFIESALAYQRVLVLDPENSEAQKALASIDGSLDESVKRLLRRGLQEYQRGDYKKSRRAFSIILKVRPSHRVAAEYLAKVKSHYSEEARDLFYRGLGYYNQNRHAAAIESFTKALEINPDNVEARDYLELASSALENANSEIRDQLRLADRAMKRGRYVVANGHLQNALRLDPEHPQARAANRDLQPKLRRFADAQIKKGAGLLQNGERAKAERVFRELRQVPSHRRAANRYLAKIRQAEQTRLESQMRQGETLFNARRWQEAIAVFDTLLLENPGLQRAMDLREKAESHIQTDELVRRADRQFANGSYLEAKKLYQLLAARNPAPAGVQRKLSECASKIDEKAQFHFDKGARLYGENKYSEALKEFQTVLRFKEGDRRTIEYIRKARDREKAVQKIANQ